MVNLIDDRIEGIENQRNSRRSNNWRRNRRGPQKVQNEPKTLLELEELARKAVALMEKHSPKSEHNYHIAMDLLRLQYNLNFMILCEKCCGLHVYDEILAPER